MWWFKREAGPKTLKCLEGADAVIIFCTGGDRHLAIQDDHLQQLEPLMAKGAGFGCLHYGVEVPKDKGGEAFLNWMGGILKHTGRSIHTGPRNSKLPGPPYCQRGPTLCGE